MCVSAAVCIFSLAVCQCLMVCINSLVGCQSGAVIFMCRSPDQPIGKTSAQKAADLSSIPAFAGDLFPGRVFLATVIGTPVAALPGAWRSRVSAGTGWHCDWLRWMFNLQLLCLCGNTYNCLSRSFPEIH